MSGPLETKPGIRVDSSGRWYYGENLITNEQILAYFQAGLRRKGSEYYIENKFGDLREHGTLDSVQGFPVIVRSLAVDEVTCHVTLYTDFSTFSISPDEILLIDENTLAVILPEKIPARLGPSAMAALHKYLEEDAEGYALRIQESKFLLKRSSLKELGF